MKAVAQFTITDLNDAIIAGEPPKNPSLNALWIKRIVDKPDELFSWNGSTWIPQTLSLAGLDPVQNEKLEDTKETADNLDKVVIPALKDRVGTNELKIEQTETQLLLKASKVDVDAISGNLTKAQSDIAVQAGQIATKVSKEEYDELDSRFVNQQSLIEQMADSITTKVSQTDYNELSNEVSIQETKVLQTASEVTILARKSDDIDGRLSTAESSITTQAGEIALKASQNSLDTLTGRVTSAEGSITTQAGQIALKASQSSLDTLSGRVSTAESSITTQAGQIALKAESANVYTKAQVDTSLGAKVNTSTYNTKMSQIDLTTSGITQRVTSTEGDIDTITGEITNIQTDVSSLEQTSTQIQATVSGIQTDVDGVEGRLTTAETQVTQNKNDIALRATKTELDTVSGRVTSAESQLTVQAGQIASKVSQTSYNTDKTAMQTDINSKAKQSDLTALTGRVSTTESSITQQAGEIASKVSQTDYNTEKTTMQNDINSKAKQTDLTALVTRVSSAETTITQHTNQIALKASQTDMDAVEGRVDEAEATLTVQAGQISSKVSQSSYDVDKTALQNSINGKASASDLTSLTSRVSTAESSITQQAGEIAQKVTQTQVDTTIANDKRIKDTRSTNENPQWYWDRYKTQVVEEFKGRATIGVTGSATYGMLRTTVPWTDSSGGSIIQEFVSADGVYDRRSTSGTAWSPWLKQEDTAGSQKKVNDFNTSVVQPLVTRMTNAETSITQTNNAIALKANKTDVDAIKGRVDTAEATLSIQTGEIASKVSQSSYTADQTALQNALNGKASTTDLSSLVTRVSSAESAITQQATSISLKANSSDVYTKAQTNTELGKKVDLTVYNNKVAEIKLTTDGITQSVSNVQGEVDAQTGLITQLDTDITTVDQKANSIQSSVTTLSERVTDQGSTITSQGTSIAQLNNSIALKAEKSDVYTKTESDGKVNTAINSAKAEIKLTTDGITQTVSNIQTSVDGQADQLSNQQSSIEQLSDRIAMTVGRTEVDELTQQMSVQETQILQTSSDVTLLANRTTETEGRMTVAESSLSVQAGQIATKVSQTDFDELEGTVTSQGTSITQLNNSIALKAEASSVYTKAQTDAKDAVKVDTSTYNTKMAEIKLTTDGITSNVSNLSTSLGTTNSNVSQVDQKADSIQSTVTSLSSTVNSQGSRITTAETAITQANNSISLKANASDVYTKTQVNTELGKKVDTTTYNNKMSAIDVSISGINQTVSSQDTEIDNLTGTVASHTTQISTIDQKADGIELRVAKTEGDVTGLSGRVGTAETKITANTNAIALKASQTSLNTLDGRVTSAEGELTVQAGQIAQRVTKTEYDANVGLNKWVVARYNMNLGSATAMPKFSHIKGKTANEIIEVLDAKRMTPFTGDYYLAHFYTNVFVQSAKTVNLSVTRDDTAGVYLNGALITEGASTTATPTSLSFRAGWNTVEILFYEHTGAEHIDLGYALSTLVDKLTCHIGIGNSNDTRLREAETSIIQTEQAIALKASQTDVTSLGNRVTATEGSINVLNTSITSKVSQTDFNAYSQRVSNAESTIAQHTNQIALKVSQTNFDELNQKVDETETSITQLTNEIALKVAKTDFDSLNGRVSTAETKITANTSAIALKASQASLDSVTGRVTTAEGQLTVANNQIATKVSQVEFDELEGTVTDVAGRVTATETAITQTNNAINLKASKTEVQTAQATADGVKTTVDGNKAKWDTASTDATNAKNAIADMSSDGKVTPVEKVQLKKEWATMTAEKVSYEGMATTYGVTTEKTNYTNAYNALNTVLNGTGGVLVSMTTTSTVTATSFRATFDDYYDKKATLIRKINETSRTLANNAQGTANTANSTANTLRDTTIPALVTRVTNAESEIDQTTEAIALRVTKTEMDNQIDATKNYVQSRTENLVTNGTGLLRDNTNFKSFAFDGSQVFAGGGSFFTDRQNSTLFNDELIPVDSSQKYRFSLMAKSLTTLGKNYFGIVSYDVDGYSISPYDFYGSQYPITTLARDLKVGDTQIFLTSSNGFMDNSETPNHTHSIVFWGYKNNKGYEYPAGTYSRNHFTIAWNKDAINRTTHVITLNKPFSVSNPSDPQGVYRAGHQVSPTSSGGSYQYMTAGNVNVPKDWTKYEGTITGNGISSFKFPYGTSFIKLMFLTNRSTSGGQAGDNLWVNSLEFSNITQEENAKSYTESSVSQAKSEIKITTDGISQTVSSIQSTVNSQGETITSQQTAINQMNGKIDLKAESSTLTTVSGVANTANTTANTLKDTTVPALATRITSAESSISVQAGLINSKVTKTEVDNAIGAVKIGGSNLLLASNTPFTTTAYMINQYELTEDWIAGEEYTFVIKGSVPAGQKFGIWMNDGSANQGYMTTVYSAGVTYCTFTASTPTTTAKRTVNLYNYPNNTTSSTVEWVALYKGNKPMDWSPSQEDVNSSLYELSSRLQSAEQAITEDSIIATVTSSQSFADVIDSKADAQALANNYTDNNKLDQKFKEKDSENDDKIKTAIGDIDLDTYTKFSQLKQNTENITANFTSAGGVNLIKNSVGFAGFDFWTKTGTIEIRQNVGLDVLGYGSGFYAEKGKNGTAYQTIPVTPNRPYTLTVVMDKSVDNATNGHAIVEVFDDATLLKQLGKVSGSGVTIGYETFTYTFIPKTTVVKININVGINAVATVTGLMLNVGDQPLQWTMAHGEIYNTNVRFDMKGIKVSKIEDDKESKFTVMTPDKFAGYYDVNGDGIIDSNNGSVDEVFRMDEDSFIMKKAVVKEEVAMGTVKIINISTTANKGWAFIADI